MKVKFQFADHTEWEGHPGEAGSAPGKGVIRMWAIDNSGRRVEFVYDDFYYLYPEGEAAWVFGSGTPKREFVLADGQEGTRARELEVTLPENAIVRLGETVSREEAVAFGLIRCADDAGSLAPKAPVTVKVG